LKYRIPFTVQIATTKRVKTESTTRNFLILKFFVGKLPRVSARPYQLIFIYVISQVIITHSAHLTNWTGCPDTVVRPTLCRRPKGQKARPDLPESLILRSARLRLRRRCRQDKAFGKVLQLAPTAGVGYNFIVS
jgi:hypothetical protein